MLLHTFYVWHHWPVSVSKDFSVILRIEKWSAIIFNVDTFMYLGFLRYINMNIISWLLMLHTYSLKSYKGIVFKGLLNYII